jgi:hypothetical protein
MVFFFLKIARTPQVSSYDIQGVSEFHRQIFRTDSIIKNRHKTLNTYGVKKLSLRDNRQKT